MGMVLIIVMVLTINIVMLLIKLSIKTDDIGIILCHIQVPEPSHQMEETGKSESVVGAKKPPFRQLQFSPFYGVLQHFIQPTINEMNSWKH